MCEQRAERIQQRQLLNLERDGLRGIRLIDRRQREGKMANDGADGMIVPVIHVKAGTAGALLQEGKAVETHSVADIQASCGGFW